jgi:hypothetical protein
MILDADPMRVSSGDQEKTRAWMIPDANYLGLEKLRIS